jgi:hypothetical protein
MPLCGNCHRHHASSEEVRACYGFQQESRRKPRLGSAASNPDRPKRSNRTPSTPRSSPPVLSNRDEGWSERFAGSSTLHRAGQPEAKLGAKCSSCGAFVPGGAAHDC